MIKYILATACIICVSCVIANCAPLSAAQCRGGTWVIIKQFRTSAEMSGYDAGDVVRFLDGDEVYARFGDKSPFGTSEEKMAKCIPGSVSAQDQKTLMAEGKTTRRSSKIDKTLLVSGVVSIRSKPGQAVVEVAK